MESTGVRTGGGQLLRLLPEIYQELAADENAVGREASTFAAFLAVLESMLLDEDPESGSLAAIISSLPSLMRAADTRAGFLPWLAQWVGLDLPPDVPLDVQRQLLEHAVALYQRRGTPAGLQQLLDIVCGGRAKVSEPEGAGFRVGAAIVGESTKIGRDRPHYFEIVMQMRREESPDLERLARAFVDLSKPAHTQYAITFVAGRDARAPAGGSA